MAGFKIGDKVTRKNSRINRAVGVVRKIYAPSKGVRATVQWATGNRSDVLVSALRVVEGPETDEEESADTLDNSPHWLPSDDFRCPKGLHAPGTCSCGLEGSMGAGDYTSDIPY